MHDGQEDVEVSDINKPVYHPFLAVLPRLVKWLLVNGLRAPAIRGGGQA